MTKRRLAVAFMLTAAACGMRASDPRTEEEKALYAIGAQIYRQQVARLKLNQEETEILKRGFSDAASGASLIADPQAYQDRIQQRLQRLAADDSGQEKLRGTAYQTQAALESGAVKTDSGLIIRSLKPGSGRSPTRSDLVKAHYRGTLVSGTVFDSSYERSKPLEFSLDGVIPCWTEGLQRMKVGEKARLVCPPEMAYGDRGFPPAIPGGATLVFEIELVSVRKR